MCLKYSLFMKHNYDTIRLNAQSGDIKRILNLIEEICDRYNLHNYFGIFSITIDEIITQIINSHIIDRDNLKIEFSFEQCSKGVLFRFNSNKELYFKVNEIIELLSSEIINTDSNKNIEIAFYIDGIDQSELITRQNIIKNYLINKTNKTTKLSHGD